MLRHHTISLSLFSDQPISPSLSATGCVGAGRLDGGRRATELESGGAGARQRHTAQGHAESLCTVSSCAGLSLGAPC